MLFMYISYHLCNVIYKIDYIIIINVIYIIFKSIIQLSIIPSMCNILGNPQKAFALNLRQLTTTSNLNNADQSGFHFNDTLGKH